VEKGNSFRKSKRKALLKPEGDGDVVGGGTEMNEVI